MARFEMARLAITPTPARRPVAIWSGFVPLGCIQTQSGDDGKGMTVTRINSDPFSFACSAKGSEFVGTNRLSHQSGSGQDIRDCSRTIVASVEKFLVTAAITIWFPAKLVPRPDCCVSPPRCIRRRGGPTQMQNGFRSGKPVRTTEMILWQKRTWRFR